jgi:hypothetical protein
LATATPATVGRELEDQLLQAIREAKVAPLPGARDLPVLFGLKARGGFTEPQENVLLKAVTILVASGRVYVYGDTVVLQVQRLDSNGIRLAPLRTGSVTEPGAADLLANILVCRHKEDQFPLPKWFADLLLRSEVLTMRLPQIRHYAARPVFDSDFILRGPGWHTEVGILVHGPDIEPTTNTPAAADGPAIERLPIHLRTLLRGFCFRLNADVANTIGLMLTGVLMNHFAGAGKPVGLIDGNQPGLGKTLLVRVIGLVLDDVDPRLIHFTQDDDELQKRICATLRDSRQSVLLIDNAKVRRGSVVTSPTIEANSMAPEVSLRILGKSENYTRPNDVLWTLTMNDTCTSPDLVSRGLPVQLAFEGKPEDRTFDGADPIGYAREHRRDILGELAGMVVRWNQQGRPNGQRSHRLHQWAAVVGGILESAGLPEFLENAGTAAASFNTELDELAALAEAVIDAGGPYIVQTELHEGECNADGRHPKALTKRLGGLLSESEGSRRGA